MMTKLKNFLMTISLSIIILCASIIGTLNFKPLFYLDVKLLDIPKISGMSKDVIVENYNYLIAFTTSVKYQQFKLPSLSFSEGAAEHFQAVRNIFMVLDILLIASLVIFIILLIFNKKTKDYSYLKHTSIFLVAFITSFLAIFAVNFDAAFNVFHQIFFKGGYWEFNPNLDPVINMLPEAFFMHCALLILIFIAIAVTASIVYYKKKKRDA